MASSSRALLVARLRPLPAAAASYRAVRPLAAAANLPPARPWLSPAVGPGTRRAATYVLLAAIEQHAAQFKETVANSDSEDSTSDEHSANSGEDTTTSDDDDDDDVEKTSGGSTSEKTNWYNNRPIIMDGCDFKHWLVVMEQPPGDRSNPDVPRDEIIDSYIKTLAQVVGSEEKARKKIYSVSTRHYFAFGARISQGLSYKLKELPNVRWILADSYLDAKNKDYGGSNSYPVVTVVGLDTVVI